MSAAISVDPDLAERFTGQREVISIENARLTLEKEAANYQRASGEYARLLALERSTCQQLKLARRRWRISQLPRRIGCEPWALLLAFCGVLAVIACLSLLLVAEAGPVAIICASMSPFLLMFSLPFFFPADLSSLKAAVERLTKEHRRQNAACHATYAQLNEIEARRYAAEHLLAGLNKAANYPLNRLLNADFRGMSGPEFEDYLADVFHFLGYMVQRTGQSRDQGVDLVLTRNGDRIAVQAKCYSGSVGNAAVQEVYAGMQMYQCKQCVVITSSWFTRSAAELAEAVDCRLIDGDQIEGIIRGRIAL